MCVLFDAGWSPLHHTYWKQAEGEGVCLLRPSGLQDLLYKLENFGFPTDRFFGDATDRHARDACLRFFSLLFFPVFLASPKKKSKKKKNMKQLQKNKNPKIRKIKIKNKQTNNNLKHFFKTKNLKTPFFLKKFQETKKIKKPKTKNKKSKKVKKQTRRLKNKFFDRKWYKKSCSS